MGKRSSFERRERDFYPTPEAAAWPLISHLPRNASFIEPCAGDGALVGHLAAAGFNCMYALDIEPKMDGIIMADAMSSVIQPWQADLIITNPPWSRDVLHPMIRHFSAILPTWLLFDADWMHTRQSAEFMPLLRKVVSVGRVKWIPDSKMTGKDNAAWYLFDASSQGDTVFVGRAA